MTAKNRLIFPLDVPDTASALELAGALRDEVGLFKIGLELYLAEGPSLLLDLIKEAHLSPDRIFLDLKVYDIPATVIGALQNLWPGLALITVPSDVGPTGLKKIVAAAGGAFRVLAVTVLTSISAEDLSALGYDRQYWEDFAKLVLLRAKMAREAGCHGVVCSGQEVKAVKEQCGKEFLTVCPGIRPEWAHVSGDDQKRIVTPYQAIKEGADYIVVGRPIRQEAGREVEAARRVVKEIEAGLRDR